MAGSSRSNTQRRTPWVRTSQLASCSIRSPAGRSASVCSVRSWASVPTAGDWQPARRRGSCRRSPRWIASCDIPRTLRFVAFEPDGRTLLTVSGPSILRRWDRATGTELAQPVGPTLREGALDLSPDGRLLLTAQGNVARVFEIGTGKEIGPPMEHDTPVTQGAFASDGSAVVTLERQTCRVWKVGIGRPLGPPQTHEGRVETVALGPRGALVYTAESVRERKGDKLRNVIWDTVSGQPKSQVGPVAKAIGGFSLDGTRLFLGSPNHVDNGSLGVWDPSTGESIATIGFSPSEVGGVTDAAFSPDGRLLVVGFDRSQIMVYEADMGQPVGPLKGRFSPFLATDEDPDGRVPSQPTNRTRARDSSPVALAISPEGQSVLIGFENGIARLATLPVQVPEERVPDWLVARTGTMLNPQATVDILKHEAWYQRWRALAPTRTASKESDEPAGPAPGIRTDRGAKRRCRRCRSNSRRQW